MAKKKKATKKKKAAKKGPNTALSPAIKFAKNKDVKAACREIERDMDDTFKELASL